MTPQEFAKLQRDFLIKTEKRSALLLDAEFARLKAEITEYLFKNLSGSVTLEKLYARNFLDKFLARLTEKVDILSSPFSRIVARAQTNVINFTSGELKKYLKLKIESSIFSPDREAIRNLIGRAFEGKTLQQVFARMKEPMANCARASLIEGFALGESNAQIAKRIEDVTGMARYRALVLSRNETVMAYRLASTQFYAEAGITEYRFLSQLDARTCLVCWRLHGTKWKLKAKPHIHTQCRCVCLPVLKSDGEMRTGTELFNRLETGFQKQILGAKRYELFSGGKSLKSLVGVKESEDFGRTFFVRNLSDVNLNQ